MFAMTDEAMAKPAHPIALEAEVPPAVAITLLLQLNKAVESVRTVA